MYANQKIINMDTVSLKERPAIRKGIKAMKEIYRLKIPEAGSITPHGWLCNQLSNDLTEGYTGHFDRISNSVNHDVFINQNRRSRKTFSFRKEWWNGEHEGYWKDSVIRSAFLTGNKGYISKAEEWIERLINRSLEKGYIGIYEDCTEDGCRFRHNKGNGELWTTSRILMGMLAYYEFTRDKRVITAAENAVTLVMKNYADDNYFATKSKGGGISHGVGFFEVLEYLFRITGNKDYMEYAGKLHSDFNNGQFRDVDLTTESLLDMEKPFFDHGAHIAEGLFVPQFAAQITGKEENIKAANNVIPKLQKHLTPSGAMRCDEWIKGREGNADERYEYCGIAEMISPLNKMLSMTGNFKIADMVETMVFNAGQGARFPVLSALSYLSMDNRIKINHHEWARRESYDSAHIAAVCCVLNGSRLMPYYSEGLWMENTNNQGVVANMYAPCDYETKVDNIPLRISEKTEYPFSDTVSFHFHTKGKLEIPFTLRKPFGCKIRTEELPNGATVEEKGDHIIIHNMWQNNDIVKIRFEFKIERISQPASKTVKEKGIYLKRGPLVYALSFGHRSKKVNEYKKSGFYRYKLYPVDKQGWNYQINRKDDFKFRRTGNDFPENPWDKPYVQLSGKLRDKNNNAQNVNLVPMGCTVFRRVTFSAQN